MRLLHEAEDRILDGEAIILPLYFYVVQNLYDERDFAGLEPNLLNLIDLRAVQPLRGHRGRPRETSVPAASGVAKAATGAAGATAPTSGSAGAGD